ncbi:MAG TPA: FAD-dependent oxidoreductase [Verrucomicrobiales bacterium]|nr:FAD-dependent oxidoreductase [Verrucomicrobiales bacterium]
MRVTIVGQGLAGTILAWQVLREGGDVRVVDRGDRPTASQAAAGLITPLTGRRLALSWRFPELLPAARSFYDWAGRMLKHELFRPRTISRVFRDAVERETWEGRASGLEPWVSPVRSAGLPRGIRAPWGFGEMKGGGVVNTECFLRLSRERWIEEGRFRWGETELGHGSDSGGPTVFCTGIAAAAHPDFAWLPFRPAKGEILTLRIDGFREERVWNRAGHWLLPVGGEHYRCGATYSWDRLDSEPSKEAREDLERRLSEYMDLPWEVVEQKAAIRPVIRWSRLVMGSIPGASGMWVFNGLGSKGALTAPFFARQLARCVLKGEPIDAEAGLPLPTG